MPNNGKIQALVHHVQVQHAELQRMVNELREHAARLPLPGQAADAAKHLGALLPQLRVYMQKHFELEERGGWLEEAASHMPKLSPHLTELERQHQLLLDQADQLEALLSQPLEALQAGASRFQTLADAIAAHEAQEESVLAQGFNQDIPSIT